jgi:penicillin-binding protein 1A
MVKYGYIKKKDADSLCKLEIKLNYRKLTHNEGPAPYFREQIRKEAGELIADKRKADGSEYNLYSDGLKIYTTVNYQMQVYAEAAIREHLSQLQKAFDKQWKGKEPWRKDLSIAMNQIKQSGRYQSLIDNGYTQEQAIEEMRKTRESSVFNWNSDRDTIISPLDSVLYHFKMLQPGMIVMNGLNGDVLAWIGGADYKFFKYDHVKAKRQAGSTFKPLVYAAALEAGISPCDYFANDSTVYTAYDNWTPQNSDRKYGGYYSMKGALAHSINTVSAKIIMQTGIDNAISVAHKMGIQSDLPEVPSLALGTGEISLYELVQAYCVFENKGRPVTPRMIRRIEDSQGRVIYTDPAHTPGDTVISEKTAETILAMLEGTVNRGTAYSLRGTYGFTNEMAGKTGTTQNQTDSWFVGMIPNLVIGVWVGGDNPAVRFRNMAFGQGSYSALPVYAKFMSRLYSDPLYKYMKNSGFNIPEEITNRLTCDDFSDKEIIRPLDILHLDETRIGEFIRKIFGRNHKQTNQDSINR